MNLNQIFHENQYTEAYKFAEDAGYIITEIEPDENGRRFQIQEPKLPSERDLFLSQIGELRQNLAETDYQAIKFAEGELTEDEYAEIKAKRKSWRYEINQLEEKLKNLS